MREISICNLPILLHLLGVMFHATSRKKGGGGQYMSTQSFLLGSFAACLGVERKGGRGRILRNPSASIEPRTHQVIYSMSTDTSTGLSGVHTHPKHIGLYPQLSSLSPPLLIRIQGAAYSRLRGRSTPPPPCPANTKVQN